jgi:hypothetical protein
MVEPSKPDFGHDQQNIAEALTRLPVVLDHQVPQKIDPKTSVDTVPDWLKCHLCGNVANLATMCGAGKCGKIFCRPCIANHGSTDLNCPNEKFVHKFKEVELLEMFDDALVSLSFNCENCTEVYDYNDCFSHRKLCMLKAVSCVLNCGDKTLYKGNDAHLSHYTTDCLKVDLICSCCSARESKATVATHSCVSGLIAKVSYDDGGSSLQKTLAEMNEKMI